LKIRAWFQHRPEGNQKGLTHFNPQILKKPEGSTYWSDLPPIRQLKGKTFGKRILKWEYEIHTLQLNTHRPRYLMDNMPPRFGRWKI